MDLGLKNKLALVTASGRGIGRGIALELAREGARVAVVSRTKADIESVIAEMGGREAGHCGFVLNLVQKSAPAKLLRELKNNFGNPNIVVHNLGGTLDIKDPFCSLKDWRAVWRLNLEVAIELNRAFIPSMKNKRWGRIINISSIASMENQGPVTYCSVKAALTAYSRSMGRVLAPYGIIVAAVLPGAVFTQNGYWDIALRERRRHVKEFLTERMAIGRLGRIDEIAGIVAFLCSERASFCVGSVVPVDGGQGRSFFGQ